MKPVEKSQDYLSRWDGAVAFRLFADQDTPTLTVPEQIAARIGDRIIAGDLAPGSRIVEQELAAEFEVSRGPIRDALRILEREGLVTILARRATVVTQLTTDEVREIFEENFKQRDEVGAAVAIYLDGKSVVDLWGGFADKAQSPPRISASAWPASRCRWLSNSKPSSVSRVSGCRPRAPSG